MKTPLAALILLASLAASGGAEAAVRNFFAPEWNGERLSACTASGQCGKPAADAWCKAQGYDQSIMFQREPVAQASPIDSTSLCTAGGCTAFKQIKCHTGKSDFAGLQ